MNSVMIYLDEKYQSESVDLMEIVQRIYQDEDVKTYGVALEDTQNQINGYFDVLIHLDSEKLNKWDVRRIAACLEELYVKYQFDCIIIPATINGRMLAPTLAARLQSGLVADVTDVWRVGEKVHMVRPAFDGKVMAVIENQNSRLVMMSARPGVFQYQKAYEKHTQIISWSSNCSKEEGIHLLASTKKEQAIDIREAKVLISGGGGVKDGFQDLRKLALQLNGMVSASRRIVDSGIAPRNIQVGQSGKTVSPQLYMALGIYGSLQHVEGMKDIEHVISVNTNPNAPICSLSQIVVEGDALEFMEKLSKRIQMEKEKQES